MSVKPHNDLLYFLIRLSSDLNICSFYSILQYLLAILIHNFYIVQIFKSSLNPFYLFQLVFILELLKFIIYLEEKSIRNQKKNFF